MSIAARLPRPVATLDPKRIAGTSLAIAVHGVVLMMLLMPMQVADPPARLDTPMVVLPIHTIPPPVDPPPRDERPRPVIRQTQTTPRPVEVPVLNTDPSPVDTYVEQVTLDPVPDTDFRVDPPPTFARIVADVAPPPTYPPQALRLRQSGEVVLRVLVDEQRCVGCGTCVVQAPKVFRLDARGKAEVMTPVQTWSPVEGAYVLNCPTDAISVRPEETAA